MNAIYSTRGAADLSNIDFAMLLPPHEIPKKMLFTHKTYHLTHLGQSNWQKPHATDTLPADWIQPHISSSMGSTNSEVVSLFTNYIFSLFFPEILDKYIIIQIDK